MGADFDMELLLCVQFQCRKADVDQVKFCRSVTHVTAWSSSAKPTSFWIMFTIPCRFAFWVRMASCLPGTGTSLLVILSNLSRLPS